MAGSDQRVQQRASRYWESVGGEYDEVLTEVKGVLPPDLTGTLYRNGSGRWNIGPSRVDSIFDADGMISAFALDGRSVRFKNRFVRTKHYVRSTAAGRMIGRGLAFQRPGGWRANALRLPVNTANTNVLIGDDKLLALWEAGRPHGVDLDTLNTLGLCSLDGALRGPVGAYSAHYRRDPLRESLVNFGFDPYVPRIDLRFVRAASTPAERRRRLRDLAGEAIPRLRLRLYETDRAGRTSYVRAVPLPAMGLIHDMALTQRYAVFTLTPLRINPWALAGHQSYWDAMHFKENVPCYFVLAPRDGGRVRIVETDPFYMWHYANAYDDGSDVVVELPRISTGTFGGMRAFGADTRLDLSQLYADVDQADVAEAVQLTRFRITATGRVNVEPVSDVGCEFPQIDQRRSAQAHTITYVTAPLDDGTVSEGIARIDHADGSVQRYQPPGHRLVEPIFVPRPDTHDEEAGWVLTVGYDEAQHRSRLMIFDAAHIDSGPVAEAWLPHHLPMSYHGAFTPRVAALS